ncbi:MAG: TIM barrel protein [Candidatus Hydrogenedentes bacterium]|nr:TIM barrel protein [Candidatus Hydrogenedentota bacterium]
MTRPTFFEHFDGVSVDWRYLRDRDAEALAREAGWIARQGLRVIVDCTSGINLYPDLRMVNNDPEEFAESMETFRGLFEKMTKLGAEQVIVSLHRHPENNFTGEQTRQSFEETLRTLCADAAARGITVYLRTTPKTGESINGIVAMVDRVAAPNLRWAASTAMLVEQKANAIDVAALLKDRPGLWLASMPAHDAAGKAWTMNAPLAENPDTALAVKYIAAAPGEPVLLDGVYANWDEEYGDVRLVETN